MYAIRLFFGGFHRIQIVKLSLIDTKQVFGGFIAAMCYFDKMISGGIMYNVKAKKYYFDFMKALIDFSLGRSNKPKFDPYIIDSFQSLRQHKRQLVFDLWQLSQVDENIRNLVLHSCESIVMFDSNKFEREFDDFTNLFKAELLSIFPNIEQVIIRTAGVDGQSSYPLSMSNLLSIISSSSLNKIVVDSWCDFLFGEQGTWINTLWQSGQAHLENKFASSGFTISFEHEKDKWKHRYKFFIDRD